MLRAYTMLLLLPLAMATCPCPPAPASAKVCGSDYVTYDSKCALDCAAKTGLSTLYSGPCRLESVLKPFFSAIPINSSPNPRNSLRSHSSDNEKIVECIAQKCKPGGCSCSSTDAECLAKCALNCSCDCGGFSAGTSNTSMVLQCTQINKCDSTAASCVAGCKDASCVADCVYDRYKCGCKCNGSVGLQSTLGLTVALVASWLLLATRSS